MEASYETKEVDCVEYTITSGGYDGLWTSIFVKPLAWVILFFGKITTSFGIGLIITSILIRLIVYPLTKKSTVQAENMKKIQPELQKIEKKYANKDQKDREIMMMKSQEMMALYKKHNVSPMAGCLPALLQLPLFIAFLDAINRVPAIFEEKFLFFHLGTTPRIGIGNGNWWYIILTLLVAVTTYFSLNKASNNTSVGDNDMAKQTKMMTNIFTILIIVMSVFMSSALNIYWITSNVCTLVQNYIVKRSMK
jgi:YidC/Oxa1 family membrane protein insertase